MNKDIAVIFDFNGTCIFDGKYHDDDFEIKDYPAIMEVHKKMFDRNFMVRRLCELEYLMFRMTGHVLRDIPFIRYFQKRNVNINRT